MSALHADDAAERGAECDLLAPYFLSAAQARIKIGFVSHEQEDLQFKKTSCYLGVRAALQDEHRAQKSVEKFGVGLALFNKCIGEFEKIYCVCHAFYVSFDVRKRLPDVGLGEYIQVFTCCKKHFAVGERLA